MTAKILRFLRETHPPTPCLVADVDHIAANYDRLQKAFPFAKIFYAMKANPAPAILKRLVQKGANFDAASLAEIEQCLAAGARAHSIAFGNTIKKTHAITRAEQIGCRAYVFDSEEELEKIARLAPRARVFCRLAVENSGADWPLSRKFGASSSEAHRLLLRARDLNLEPFGLSFHVGSQQTSTQTYEQAIAHAAHLFGALRSEGISLQMLNLGGGFPIAYRETVPDIEFFGQTIQAALRHHFGDNRPEIWIEPGRFLVGDAGIIVSEVVLATRRGDKPTDPRWVYLDIGRFGGLAETEGEAIRYQIVAEDARTPMCKSIIAGPTCDSVDTLYENNQIELPESLGCGDRLFIFSTGAYVTTYCSVGFNGFAPLEEIYL